MYTATAVSSATSRQRTSCEINRSHCTLLPILLDFDSIEHFRRLEGRPISLPIDQLHDTSRYRVNRLGVATTPESHFNCKNRRARPPRPLLVGYCWPIASIADAVCSCISSVTFWCACMRRPAVSLRATIGMQVEDCSRHWACAPEYTWTRSGPCKISRPRSATTHASRFRAQLPRRQGDCIAAG